MKQHFTLTTIIQAILLMVVWLLLSGHYDIVHISMGVISVAVVVLLNYRLRKYYFFEEKIKETTANIKDMHTTPLRYLRTLYYVPWLVWQILVASLQVAYAVLSPKMPIDPSLIRFKTKLPNVEAKVILGNSITLTPGTITVEIAKDDFLVHGLMDVSSSGIVDGSLPGEVAKLYEKKPKQVVSNVKIIKSGAEI